MTQADLFGARPVESKPKPDPERRDKRVLMRTLRAAPKGGLVNGMTKAALRRYAPARLPKVTL